MNILCVDDEALLLERLVSCVQEACPEAVIRACRKPSQALMMVENEKFDIAFLDIKMRGMNGVELAMIIQRYQPRINIIFISAFDEYKSIAMDCHASGYMMKPVTTEKVLEELAYLRFPGGTDIRPCVEDSVEGSGLDIAISMESSEPVDSGDLLKQEQDTAGKQIKVQCFGNFDVYDSKGNHVRFTRSKAKELLAYLVYRQGARCTNREIAAVLFENQEYDAKMQDLCRHVISSLVTGLKNVGAGEVVIKQSRELAVNRAFIDCDFYRFLEGDPEMRNVYSGEFMQQYSWAEGENAHLLRLLDQDTAL